MSEHTKGLLRVGKNGAVVADAPVPEISGSDAVEYYGGHLVAESITPANARRIVACWNLLDGYATEELDGVSLAEFVASRAELAEKALIAAYASIFTERGATNYLEVKVARPELGPFTITLQRAEGLTPVDKLAAMTKQRDVLLEALNGVLGVMNNSEGVAGWHKNGDIATWDELLPEVAAALEFVEGEQS